MKRLPLWWLPLLLLIAPLMGRAPMPRDVGDYFAPMRQWTATTLNAGEAPWLNPLNGCGEPWFANPQSAVLAPSLVPHLVLPRAWALTLEIALHLAWLSLGVGLLARRWGAEGPGRSVAELAACSVGPVLSLVGLLTNLETLAWAPWLVLAASLAPPRQVPLTALAVAGAWLGGDPQLCALSMAVALAAATRRLTALLGMGLGLAIVSVQLIPFAALVLEGDRGPSAAAWVLPGALAPRDLLGLLAPIELAGSRDVVYLPSLVMGAPLVVIAVLGIRQRPKVAFALAPLLALAVMPTVGGEKAYLLLTHGLVRFPSRFAILPWAALLPLAGLGVKPWLIGRGRGAALAVGSLGLAASLAAPVSAARPIAALASGLTLIAALPAAGPRVRAATLAIGMLVPLSAATPLLGLQQTDDDPAVASAWPEARTGGRLYSLLPTPAEEVAAATRGIEAKRLWPMGYLNLDQHLSLVRSPAAVLSAAVAGHVEVIDGGPTNRWWLDVVAARWLVVPPAVPNLRGFEVVREREGFRLLRNPSAQPVVSLAEGPPHVDHRSAGIGGVLTLRSANDSVYVVVETSRPAALRIALAPVGGWRWRLDGRPTAPIVGPGALVSFPMGPGAHRVSGRYRPPGVIQGAGVSLIAIAVVAALLWRSRRPGEDAHSFPGQPDGSATGA